MLHFSDLLPHISSSSNTDLISSISFSWDFRKKISGVCVYHLQQQWQLLSLHVLKTTFKIGKRQITHQNTAFSLLRANIIFNLSASKLENSVTAAGLHLKCFFKHKTEASYVAISLVNRACNQEAQLDVLKPRSTEQSKKNTLSHMDRKPLKQQSTEHRGGKHGFRGYIIVAAE